MRILHVTYAYSPLGSIADGITNLVYQVTRELAKRGHEVSIFASNAVDLKSMQKTREKELTIDRNLHVRYFDYAFRWGTFFLTPSICGSMRNRINEFDVIHIHDARSFQGIAAHHFACKNNLPYVYQPHGSFLSPLPQSNIDKILRISIDKIVGLRIVRNASKVVTLSQFEAKRYESAGIPRSRIAIVPNGINLAEYAYLPTKGTFKRKLGIRRDVKMILYLGRIHKTKRIDLLIKAYAYLVKNLRLEDALLVIAGPDDRNLAEMESLARTLGISALVLFTGFISRENRLAALRDADVFVTPSFYGFPMTFLEACASGTPIVTTKLGDNLEWIHDNTGFVVPPTPQDLAEAIHRITSDDSLRERFSRNCMRLVRSEFTIEKVVDKVEKVYQEVTSKWNMQQAGVQKRG